MGVGSEEVGGAPDELAWWLLPCSAVEDRGMSLHEKSEVLSEYGFVLVS